MKLLFLIGSVFCFCFCSNIEAVEKQEKTTPTPDIVEPSVHSEPKDTILLENDTIQITLLNQRQINCTKNLIQFNLLKLEPENISITASGGTIAMDNSESKTFALTPFCDDKDFISIIVNYRNEDGSHAQVGNVKLKINK